MPCLVELRKLPESDGEGLRPVSGANRKRRNETGIDPAAQQEPNRDVCDKLPPHGLGQQALQPIDEFVLRL